MARHLAGAVDGNHQTTTAAEGVGVALGRQPMIAAELESGRLVRPFGDSIAAGDMVHIARWRPGGLANGRIAAFRDWLIEETGGPGG